jgi:hypothetical protein
MEEASEQLPDEPAPVSGTYEQLNVFGSPTGDDTIYVKQGDRLPKAPRGYTWRLLIQTREE